MKRAVLLLLFASLCYAQSSSVDVHAAVLKTYSFEPHTLDQAGLQQHSNELDRFWNAAKANPAAYLPGLRTELQNPSDPKFFFYDGSMLLLSLSNTPADREIAAQAIARCDLRDVQSLDYLMQVHKLAVEGADVTPPALHILEDPKFTAFVPQHVLTLAQNYSFIVMVLPMKEETWTPAAIKRLQTEKDSTAIKTLLLALWYAQMDSADAALEQFAADASRPADLRKAAKDLLARNHGVPTTARAKVVLTSEESLRAKRRQVMSRVSDEALDDLDEVTAEIVAKRAR